MMLRPKFLVVSGDGINCERETKQAIELEGGDAEIIHVNELAKRKQMLRDYQGMALPGGFSFGDELGSGQIMALKIKHTLKDEFTEFVESGKAIVGICNGFQILLKLGLLPSANKKRSASLAKNSGGRFINKWSKLLVNRGSVCKWTMGFYKECIELPIRHGEGRVVFKQEHEREIYDDLLERGQIPFTYSEDINGSYQKIAGICDESGMVLGLMPHPEAAMYKAVYRNVAPDPFQKGDGAKIFSSMINYLNQK